MKENPCIGKEVIAKFFNNGNQENSNKIITKTMGKVAFIDRSYQGPLPKGDEEEFWRVKIVDERKPGERSGCFIIEPLERVKPVDLKHLVQGFYEEKMENGVLFILPKNPGHNWILPLTHRKSIRDVVAILVCL